VRVPLLVFVIASCSGTTPKTHEPSKKSGMVVTCAQIEEDQRTPVRSGQSIWPAKEARGFPAPIGRCFAGARIAWAVVLEGAKFDKAGLVRGRWSLLHVDGDGHRAKIAPTIPYTSQEIENDANAPNLDAALSIDEPVLFDFDGDGDEEVFVRVAWKKGSLEVASRGRIYTFKDSEIRAYDRARTINVENLRDVDADGRPDLLTFGPYEGTSRRATVCDGAPYRVHGVTLIAHSVSDGSFRLDDAVALAFAKKACPLASSEVSVKGDAFATVERISCARLSGVSEKAIVDDLEANCSSVPTTGCATASSCDDPALWKAWAKLPPPLSWK